MYTWQKSEKFFREIDEGLLYPVLNKMNSRNFAKED